MKKAMLSLCLLLPFLSLSSMRERLDESSKCKKALKTEDFLVELACGHKFSIKDKSLKSIDECPICAELKCSKCKKEALDDFIKFQPCGHRFHISCLKNIKKCPCLSETYFLKCKSCGERIEIEKKDKKFLFVEEAELPKKYCLNCNSKK